jgi:hypothetical protein
VISGLYLDQLADQGLIDDQFLLTAAGFDFDVVVAQIGEDCPYTTTRLGVAGIEGGVQHGAEIL